MSILDELTAAAAAAVLERQRSVPLPELERRAAQTPIPLDAVDALSPGEVVKIIAEIKRASPSRGPLAEIADPAAHAQRYRAGGASAISVLTEPTRFLGSLDDLRTVRAAVDIPVIRKDFITTPYQVVESRVAGADFLLLIVAALDQRTLIELRTLARDFGMAALVEAHTTDEVSRAVDAGAQLIGINARNLHDFALDRTLFEQMADRIPTGTIRVAESAVMSRADVENYRRAGADVVLVGEALVTGDAEKLLAEFTSVGEE